MVVTMADEEVLDDNSTFMVSMRQPVRANGNQNEEPKVKCKDFDLIPKDVGWAWMCCLGCFLQNSLTVGCAIKMFGIFYVSFMEQYDSPAGTAAWIVALCNGSLLAGGSFMNALAIKFGARVVVFTGGLVMAFGYISSMFATQLNHLFFTYGLILGLGSSMAWSVSLAHMGLFFKNRRAIANGIAMSGVGFGNLVLPPILRLLLDNYGLHGTLLVMAGLALNVCVAGALMRPPSAYKRKQKNKMNDKNNPDIDLIADNGLNNETKGKSENSIKTSTWNLCKSVYDIYAALDWSLLKKPPFFLHGICMMMYFMGFPIFFMVLPTYAETMGHSKSKASYLLSVTGFGELVGRLGAGFLVDFKLIATPLLVTLLLLLGSATSFVATFLTGYIPLAISSFLFALFMGPLMALNPILIADSFGVVKLASGLGILGLFMAVGMVASTPVGGSLKDLTGDWRASFYFCAVCLLASGVAMLTRYFSEKRSKRSTYHH